MSIVGLGVYFGSVALHVNRFVVPVPPLGYWWTIPMLVLTAIEAGLLEEVIVVAYLITRLEQIGWPTAAAVGASALLRASYHLYQGWGGFAGNLLLGVFFGVVFVRTRRVWPLVIAHAMIDTLAGLGYIVVPQPPAGVVAQSVAITWPLDGSIATGIEASGVGAGPPITLAPWLGSNSAP